MRATSSIAFHTAISIAHRPLHPLLTIVLFSLTMCRDKPSQFLPTKWLCNYVRSNYHWFV